jgi:hypothetical protein
MTISRLVVPSGALDAPAVIASTCLRCRDVIVAPGAELEPFGAKEATAEDQKMADVHAAKGAKADLDAAAVYTRRAIACETAWKDDAQKTRLSAELLKLAEQAPSSQRAMPS